MKFMLGLNAKKIIQEPQVEVPVKELWLYNNKKAMQSLGAGLNDSAEGNVSFKEDFSNYLP